MRHSVQFERVSRQTILLDENDLRAAVTAYAKAHDSPQIWRECPAAEVERVEIEFDYDEEFPLRYQARIVRTFTKAEAPGQPEGRP